MVMAETERESRSESSTNSASRLQWLRQRREALQEKLLKKNNELKNLCIDEAELTGVLPPEIPLDPGESPPLFRRRVGTSFAYPQNLINKLKTSQAEESALELERQIQTAIAKKAYVIFNDAAETKAVRRKHRLVFQQSQARLKDLEMRLNFIRQGYGRLHRRSNIVENNHWQPSPTNGDDDVALAMHTNVKHRSKKPRPPLESGLDRLPSSKVYSDKTKNSVIDQITATNDWEHQIKPNHNENGWIATNGPISSCVNSGSDSAIVHDLNDNADMYILADQCRARTYSHGNSDDGDLRHARHYPMIERGYRTISSGHADEDEQTTIRRNNMWSKEQKRQYETYHYNQRQQQQINAFKQQPQKYHRNFHQDPLPSTNNEAPSMPSYSEPLDQQISASAGLSRSRYTYYPPTQYSHLQNSDDNGRRDVQLSRPEHEPMQDRNSRRNNHESVTISRHELTNLNDNWIAPDDEESVWHSERSLQQSDNGFGSIDRQKQNDSNSSINNIHHYQATNQEVLSTTQSTTPIPSRYIKLPTIENKPISKYINNQQQSIRLERVEPPATRTLLRTQSLGSVENWQSVVAVTTATTCASPIVASTTMTTMQTTTTAGSVHRLYNRDNHISYRENGKEWYETSMDFSYPKTATTPQSSKNLEIPAESSRLSNRREIDLNFDTSNLTSPEKVTADGRTIVHAGKYQPYKEVTKPFEMSDFYKYSTKFRKKVEPTTINSGQSTHHIFSTSNNNPSTIISESSNESNNNDIEVNCDTTIECRQQISTAHAPLAQRRICNSAQSVTRQPYMAVRIDDNDIRDWSNMQASQPTTNDSTVV